MKKETIAEEVRRYFNYLKLKVMESDEPIELYLSGSMNKKLECIKKLQDIRTMLKLIMS